MIGKNYLMKEGKLGIQFPFGTVAEFIIHVDILYEGET